VKLRPVLIDGTTGVQTQETDIAVSLSIEDIATIYRRHADVVFRRCLVMLGSREDALDAVQEIFEKVLTGRLAFRGESDPTTWIYRITTNHVLNKLRARRPATPLDTLPVSISPRVTGHEGRILSRHVLGLLMERLDDRSRAIVVYHFADGLDQVEVARLLGISRRAVVKRLTRIRRLVREITGAEAGAQAGP
jgi:RNA polymerase sigma-70 factor (ECF subfamily)